MEVVLQQQVRGLALGHACMQREYRQTVSHRNGDATGDMMGEGMEERAYSFRGGGEGREETSE